jgi:hypothetical protein
VSLLIGDAAHNLRTALDFLAYALARDANPGVDLGQIYFPISESFAKYQSGLRGKTKGIPQAAIDALSLIQPYGGGNDDLWGLHQLDIIDKHRLLVTTVMITDKIWFEVDTERVNNMFRGLFNLPPQAIPKQSVPFPAPAQIQEPRQGAALHWVAGNHEADQNVNFTFDIAFGEPEVFNGKAIIPTLSQLAHLAHGIVASFT